MDPVLEMLKKRYGGNDAWNPAAGQNNMSFDEWLDRHPSLGNLATVDQRDRYAGATGTVGGQRFQESTPGWQSMGPTVRGDMMTSPTPMQQMGGPDKPFPNQRGGRGGIAPVKPGGRAYTGSNGGYQAYLKEHWGSAAGSTDKRGRAYARMQAARRRGAAPGSGPVKNDPNAKKKGSVNNTQSAH